MLKKISPRMMQVAIFCVSFMVVFVLLHIFLGMPAIRYSKRMKKEFKVKDAKLRESEGLIKTLPNPQKAIEEIEKKVREFKEMGVSKKQLPRIIQLLGRSSTEQSVSVVSIKPREDIKADAENLPAGVTKVYVEMVISGPYQKLGDYLKAMAELPVSFSIENITLEKKKEAETALEPKKADAKKEAVPEELICTLLLSTYMIWEI